MTAPPDTPAGRWLNRFLQCYNERRVDQLNEFIAAWVAPNARIVESDLLPEKVADPRDPSWIAGLLYEQRGLNVVAIDEQLPTALCATALERIPTLHGTVRIELRVFDDGRLESLRIASIPHAMAVQDEPPKVLVTTFNDDRIMRKVDAAVRELVQLELFSGVLLVAYDGVPLYVNAFGDSHVGLHHRNTPQTRFNLASITKSFTASAVLRLVQEGAFSLDDSIRHWLPDAPAAWSAVTVHQLLNHTAGFDLAVLTDDYHWLWKDRCLDMGVWWQLVKNRAPVNAPGTKTLYSNVGYVILGELISRASGRDFFEYINDVVFLPAGMTETAFDSLDLEHERRATGYTLAASRPGGPQRPRRSHQRQIEIRGGPHGFAYSTVRDLLHFTRAIRQRVLLDDYHSRLLWGLGSQPQDGYGFFRVQTHAGPLVHVSGAGPGISAWLDIHPTKDFVVAVLSNYGAPAAHRVGRRVRQLLLERVPLERVPLERVQSVSRKRQK